MGLAAGPVVPTREWRELYAALDCAAVAAIHPFYTASVREFAAAGRAVVGSAPVGRDGTAAWLDADRRGLRRSRGRDRRAPRTRCCPPSAARSRPRRSRGRITVRGYEGSELLVARLLVESGADVPLRRHRLPAHRAGPSPTATGSTPRRARAVPRLAGAGPRRLRGVRARPRHRHHAGGAARQAARHPGALLHQPDLGPAADGPGRRRLAGAGGQRRARQQGALRRDERLLRGRRHRPRRRRLGRPPRRPPASSRRSYAVQLGEARRQAPRRRSDARSSITTGPAATGARSTPSPPSRACRSSSTARSAARTCRSPRCCTTPTACRRTNCRSSSPASARRNSARRAPRAP